MLAHLRRGIAWVAMVYRLPAMEAAVCSGSGSDGQGAIGSGGRHEMMTGTARLAREGIALWPARPEEGGGTLLSHQWRTRRGDREQRVREIVKRERARGGRALGLSLLLEQGGRGGAHARARGSHVASGAYVRSDDGTTPEAFKIDKKSTEFPNFFPLYLPMALLNWCQTPGVLQSTRNRC